MLQKISQGRVSRTPYILLLVIASQLLGGCGQLISNAKKEFAQDLSASIQQHNEPETVKQALPAFLLLVDSMVRGDDTDIELLISASKLYGAYTSAFVVDEQRRQVLAQRAFTYAHRALCLYVGNENVTACNIKQNSYATFEQALKKFKRQDVEVLFAFGTAWAGLVQANSSDWNAVAELPKVKAVIERVLALDETYSNGDAHLYMGVMESLLPPAMGGKPELAKNHFERALEISERTNSMALLLYAEKYARLVFDRPLHDKLLNELLALKPEKTNSKLIDAIAKARAGELMQDADDYF